MWLTACSTAPVEKAPPAAPVDIPKVMARFEAHQAQLGQRLRYWRAEGVLDLETERESRRNRMELAGDRRNTLRMRIYGPMRQPAVELWMGRGTLRLLDLDRRQNHELPANAQGLAQLIGIPIEPARLVDFLLGYVGAVAVAPQNLNAVPTASETLAIDPVSAHLNVRRGVVDGTVRYEASYQWADLPPSESRSSQVSEAKQSASKKNTSIPKRASSAKPESVKLPDGMMLPPGFELALALPAPPRLPTTPTKAVQKAKVIPNPQMPSRLLLRWWEKERGTSSWADDDNRIELIMERWSHPSRHPALWKGPPFGFRTVDSAGEVVP
ncbi:MAG: hypothetical protein HQL53_06685 [Magnetococcales bacterium]|nr:hypothetical protein [Magnetococcales bacterium]